MLNYLDDVPILVTFASRKQPNSQTKSEHRGKELRHFRIKRKANIF